VVLILIWTVLGGAWLKVLGIWWPCSRRTGRHPTSPGMQTYAWHA